jgi:carbon monoxide dehydrogenase subunit G
VILERSLAEAWAALSGLPPVRGTVAGYSGTARLEEVDDDTHTAILRLTGTGPNGPVTATITATLEASDHGTRLHFSTRAHPQPDAQSIHALTATLAAALTRPGAPQRLISARLQ